MELTWMAEWLNHTFAGFDYWILELLHTLAVNGGFIITPFMRVITIIGEKGILMFALALFLMCFAKTRKVGVCIFGAVCCGALITNVILKDFICRPRPFLDVTSEFHNWWLFVGAPAESGFSFPSGHVTAAAAGMTALSLEGGRKYVGLGVVYAALMGISRNYLMAHYPSDVLAATAVGIISAVTAHFITKLIFSLLQKYQNTAVCRFALKFDIRSIGKK